MLISKIADREISRRADVETMLDYIYRQLEQLGIIDGLPEDLHPPQSLVNRAMDVKSAVLAYLATHIRHESHRLGIMGMPALDAV